MEFHQKKKWMISGIGFKNRGLLFLGAFLTALALTMDMEVAGAAEEGITNAIYLNFYKIFEIIYLDMEGSGLLVATLTVCLYLCYKKVWRERETRPIRFERGLALFLAVMYTGGVGFAFQDSLSVLFTSSTRLLKTGILLFGLYFFYRTAIRALYGILHSGWEIGIGIRLPRLLALYEKHPLAVTWTGIMASWAVHLLLRYPGIMSYDNWLQLAYYFGYRNYTTAQPVFHTWLFGSVVRLGVWLGSANAGLFAFIVMQSLVMSGILAWSSVWMKKWGSPQWLRLLTLGIYCFAPYYTGYVAFPIKDFLYTASFVWFVLLCMEWFRNPREFWGNGRYMAGWVLSVCLLILFRNNGIEVYLPVALIVGVCDVKREIPSRQYSRALFSVIGLLAPVLLAFGTKGMIGAVYHVEQNDPKEMLSLPFQQTARYVRDYWEEITEEEKEAIRDVLDYDNLPILYTEFTSDPVKSTYRGKNTEDLMNYFKVWFQQFLKHPLCYVEATWNQNYYLFAPNIDNVVYNKDCYWGAECEIETGLPDLVWFEIPEWMQGISSIMVSFYSLLTVFPVIGLFSNVAVYVILMFMTAIFMLHEKRGRELFVLLPLFLTFLIVLMAPQIIMQPRYAFPIIYAMPSALAFYCRSGRETDVPETGWKEGMEGGHGIRRKIAFHLNCLEQGGAERVVSNLANRFAREGYEVLVATEWYGENEFRIDDGVRRVHVGLREQDDKKSRLAQFLLRVKYLREFMKEEKPDILIAFAQRANYRALIASPGTKVPVLISIRTNPVGHYDAWVDKLQIPLLFPRAAGCVFQTEGQREFFAPFLQKNSRVILNPLNDKYVGVPRPERRKKEVVQSGRLVDFKNQPMLLRAFVEVHRKHPDYVLKIYGGDSFDGTKEILERIIEENHAQDYIRLMGASDTLERDLADAAVYAFSSDWEGLPNALLEAMALGLPIVATDCPCGGPRTVMEDGVNGILIPIKDQKALEAGINRLIEEPEYARRLGEQAGKIVEIANSGAIFEQWRDFIEDICRKR